MEYQWYPGHMTKARRMMEENIKLIDLVIELCDARIPLSSRNPDLDKIAGKRPRLILLNKADLADEQKTAEWTGYFEAQGLFVLSLDSRSKSGMKAIDSIVARACKEKIERDRKRGILNRPVRAMVAGIPNVGKSTFINSFAGKAVAKTGNKPGVTKGKQWIKMSKTVELLDTPGILWPKMGDPITGLNLALIGSMNDEILDPVDMASKLCEILKEGYPGVLEKRYDIDEDGQARDLLEAIAAVRGCIKKGGEPDIEKASALCIDDFRQGRLGRITLERIPAQED